MAEATGAAPASAATDGFASGRAKRERKQIELFVPPTVEKSEFTIKPGPGTKLGDIPNIKFRLSNRKPDDELLVQLHKLVFSRPGMSNKRRRNLYEFSGFPEEELAGKGKERLLERLSKWQVPMLHSALDTFDMPRGSGEEGKKESKVTRLLEFLLAPEQLSDKDLAAAQTKKKEAAKRKREKAKQGSGKKSATKPGKKKSTSEDDVEDEADEEEDEDEENEDEAEDEPAAAAAVGKAGDDETVGEKKADDEVAEAAEDEGEEQAPRKKARTASAKKATPAAKKKAAPSPKKQPSVAKKAAGGTGRRKSDAVADEEQGKALDVEMEEAQPGDGPGPAGPQGEGVAPDTTGRRSRASKATNAAAPSPRKTARSKVQADEAVQPPGKPDADAAAAPSEHAQGTAEAVQGATSWMQSWTKEPGYQEKLQADIADIMKDEDPSQLNMRRLRERLQQLRSISPADADKWWLDNKSLVKLLAVKLVTAESGTGAGVSTGAGDEAAVPTARAEPTAEQSEADAAQAADHKLLVAASESQAPAAETEVHDTAAAGAVAAQPDGEAKGMEAAELAAEQVPPEPVAANPA